MSFTSEVKKEVCSNELHQCCTRAELSGLIQLCSTLTINSNGMSVIVKTENATIAKRIWTMIKEEFEVECKLSVIKKMKLKKNNIYQIDIYQKATLILDELGILTSSGLNEHPAYKLVKKECCARAYLAGAFMATGSINAPSTPNYHLEIATTQEAHAEFIVNIMKRFKMPAKTITRRSLVVVYLKQAEKIGDYLRCIGAFDSLMKFEDVRILRDMKNSFTRLDNCEVANEMKSQSAGLKQVEDIELIMQHGLFESLDEKLKQVAQIRIANPEASLNELCDILFDELELEITKSGMKHRLKKISDQAQIIRLRISE